MSIEYEYHRQKYSEGQHFYIRVSSIIERNSPRVNNTELIQYLLLVYVERNIPRSISIQY
jgi:hypothetical protein